MKRILSITGILSLVLILLTAFSLRENPQDPPRGKKDKKHLKLVKIDEDGKKMELDTIIEGENVFVWKGDTIGGEHKLKWVSEGDFDMDFDMDFDFDVEESADRKVIIIKSGIVKAPTIHKLKMDGDSTKACKIIIISDGGHGDHNMMMFHGDEGDNEMIFHAPHMVGAPLPPEMMMKMHKQGNIIDLSDPDIISYNKKDLKDGKEKITIIRHKPVEKEIKMEEIFMHGAGNHPMIIHGKHPWKTKTLKVIKKEDKNIWHGKEGDGKVQVIEEDGKIIHIKEIKEGNEKKIEVTVVKEEKVEKEEK